MQFKTNLFYLKVKCPVGCEYCFEDTNNEMVQKYDLQKMFKTFDSMIRKGEFNRITLHGGDVLSLPIEDFRYICEEFARRNTGISVQTSLAFLTDEHIDLIKKYHIGIGISVDGPPELNIFRGPRDPNLNKIYQQNLLSNINRLRKNKIPFGSISILTKHNATGENLDKLCEWVVKEKINGRFNPMFTPHFDNRMVYQELTPEELKNAWIRLYYVAKENPSLPMSPVREFIDNLLGLGLKSCVVTRCDYINTRCNTILPDGGIGRCDRCFQDGYYYSSENSTLNRSEILKSTECKGCRYWEVCGGACPGEGIDKDYRRKSRFCEAYYGFYSFLEKEIRGLLPNVILSIDIENYYDEFFLKERKLNWPHDMGYSTYHKRR